jgi:hypothetical protein
LLECAFSVPYMEERISCDISGNHGIGRGRRQPEEGRMLMKTTDGGPAFPRSASDARNVFGEMSGNSTYPGMTLRDWFAGQAIMGLMCRETFESGSSEVFSDNALAAYNVADAMLEIREK